MSDGGSWVQWALTALGAAGSAVAGHLYFIGSAGRAAIHKKVEKQGEALDEKIMAAAMESRATFATKNELTGAIREFTATQQRAIEDHRIQNERIDEIARDVGILLGRFTQAFPSHGGADD